MASVLGLNETASNAAEIITDTGEHYEENSGSMSTIFVFYSA